jgi:hypothetical protein
VHNGDLNLVLGSWHWQDDDSASKDPAMWRQDVVADVQSTSIDRQRGGEILERSSIERDLPLRTFEDTGLR